MIPERLGIPRRSSNPVARSNDVSMAYRRPQPQAHADGTAKVTVANKAVTMADGANSIYGNGGTALMIHATADDGKTDPGGAAGDRIACGPIVK